MKTNFKIQKGKDTKMASRQKREQHGGNSESIRKNEDISTADRAEEPVKKPGPGPKQNPDQSPAPSRREYEDPGHEHSWKDPSAAI